ncbi:hypothetical protein T492DRAFT_1060313 [Pavlovales sp. CCMP2436]|nr:hypothetical protein T492DRAFT_1060313 [Pavlovales sp. CCMP2436]
MKTQNLRDKLGELRNSISASLGIAKKPGKNKGVQRKVSFGPCKVTEFERLLCGGGGVPDGDVVSLGLGRPVRTYEMTPRDRSRTADKDTYCMRGCLDARKRAELLCEWMRKKEYLVLLRKIVKPELLRLQRGREASNAVPNHLRDMPCSLNEALAQARADEVVAAKLLRQGVGGSPATKAREVAEDEQHVEGAGPTLGEGRQLTVQSGRQIRSPKRSRMPPADGDEGDDESDDDDGEEEEEVTPVPKRARADEQGAAATDEAGQTEKCPAAGIELPGGRASGSGFDQITRWLVWRDF